MLKLLKIIFAKLKEIEMLSREELILRYKFEKNMRKLFAKKYKTYIKYITLHATHLIVHTSLPSSYFVYPASPAFYFFPFITCPPFNHFALIITNKFAARIH